MNLNAIITEIDLKVANLLEAKRLLLDGTAQESEPAASGAEPEIKSLSKPKRGRGRPKGSKGKKNRAKATSTDVASAIARGMSPEGRKRIADAQKARWAAKHAAAAAAAAAATTTSTPTPAPSAPPA